jgi:hypothetical protein
MRLHTPHTQLVDELAKREDFWEYLLQPLTVNLARAPDTDTAAASVVAKHCNAVTTKALVLQVRDYLVAAVNLCYYSDLHDIVLRDLSCRQKLSSVSPSACRPALVSAWLQNYSLLHRVVKVPSTTICTACYSSATVTTLRCPAQIVVLELHSGSHHTKRHHHHHNNNSSAGSSSGSAQQTSNSGGGSHSPRLSPKRQHHSNHHTKDCLRALLTELIPVRSGHWLQQYMAFDQQPASCETAAAAALAAGVDLRAFVLPAEASARAYGDSYVYDVQALAAFVGQLGSSSSVQQLQQHQQQQLLLLEAGGDGVHWEGAAQASSRLLDAVRCANRCAHSYSCAAAAFSHLHYAHCR